MLAIAGFVLLVNPPEKPITPTPIGPLCDPSASPGPDPDCSSISSPVAEHPAPWYLWANEASTLTIAVEMVGDPTCEQIGRIAVSEADDVVEIVAYVDRLKTKACFMSVVYQPTEVVLSRPLADRALTGCMLDSRKPTTPHDDCAVIVMDSG